MVVTCLKSSQIFTRTCVSPVWFLTSVKVTPIFPVSTYVVCKYNIPIKNPPSHLLCGASVFILGSIMIRRDGACLRKCSAATRRYRCGPACVDTCAPLSSLKCLLLRDRVWAKLEAGLWCGKDRSYKHMQEDFGTFKGFFFVVQKISRLQEATITELCWINSICNMPSF